MKDFNRSYIRKIVLESVFQYDFGNNSCENAFNYFENYEKYDNLKSYEKEEIRNYISGIYDNLKEFDEIIGKYLINWDIERLGTVEKSVIRIAMFELKERSFIPVKVIMNEAIELTKIYSEADSSKFVNGILDKIAKKEFKRTDFEEA
ncbi:MAG: transcription antitermination factor NusB [Thermotogae bacterium]|nr:transcription antitermination factor NusB [Thermotogota bacterium]HOO74221.1 transcription antitermination factor NusB [Tepiditoga sp.]